MEEIECGKEKKQKGGERGRKRKGKEIDRMGRPDEGTNSLDRCIVQWKGISQEQAVLPSIPFRERYIYICVCLSNESLGKFSSRVHIGHYLFLSALYAV